MKKQSVEHRSLEWDRRTFLKSCGAALGTLALTGIPPAMAEEAAWVAVGPESAFPLDEPTLLKEPLAYVVRGADGVRALSARCTHQGCTVEISGKEFECPCHQARFSSDGTVLNGPASDPLVVLPAKVQEGQVWIDSSALK